MRYPETRQASRQAWQRLRKTMSEGELRDIARDIARVARADANGRLGVAEDTLADSLRFALTSYPHEDKTQA